jgi:hypothetical protein
MKILISSFLCLIGTLSLTACAQPAPTPVSKPVEIKTEIVKPIEKAAPIKTQNKASTKENKPMIEIDNPSRGEAIPAAELKKKILSLIGSLQSREDMSRGHVEKIMGVSLLPHPRSENIFRYFGKVNEGWEYSVAVLHIYGDDVAPSIGIGLVHKEETIDDALPKACTIDAETIVKEIDSMGFQRSDELIIMDGKMWWGFRKNIPARNAKLGVEVHVYRAENSTENRRLCVKQIDIGADPIHE